MPLGPTSIREDLTQTTTSSFRVTWEYDATRSRVTQWTVRHAEKGGAFTERSLTDPEAREHYFTFSTPDSGKTYSVEIIAKSEGASSTDVGRKDVTLSEYMIMLTEIVIVSTCAAQNILHCLLWCMKVALSYPESIPLGSLKACNAMY